MITCFDSSKVILWLLSQKTSQFDFTKSLNCCITVKIGVGPCYLTYKTKPGMYRIKAFGGNPVYLLECYWTDRHLSQWVQNVSVALQRLLILITFSLQQHLKLVEILCPCDVARRRRNDIKALRGL